MKIEAYSRMKWVLREAQRDLNVARRDSIIYKCSLESAFCLYQHYKFSQDCGVGANGSI